MSKFRQWGHDHRLKLSQDIPFWLQKFYRYHKYRQAKRQGHTYESTAAISSVEFDRDSTMESYREYRATRSISTSMSSHLMSPEELIEEINAISYSIPPFSTVHTLSLEALEDLRRDIFGAEYLSGTPGEMYPLLYPGSFDSESSVEQFMVSPENTTLLLSGNNETSFPKTSHQELPHDLSPSQITDSTSSKSSGALRSTSHVSTNSTGSSSFSMVTVSIPTLRNTDFLTTLVDTISEGQPIDSVYHPSEVLAVAETSSRPTSKEAASESLINILDPESFEPMGPTDGVVAASLSHLPDQVQLSETSTLSTSTEHVSHPTIKFKEYAEVLLYDANGRLKRGPSAYKKDSMRRLKLVHEAPYPLTKEQRAEHFKQHGSLRLYETVPTTLARFHCDDHVDFPSIRLSQSCRLKIPSFSPLSRSDAMEPNFKWKRMLTAQNQQRQLILKLKTNERLSDSASSSIFLPLELVLSIFHHSRILDLKSVLQSLQNPANGETQVDVALKKKLALTARERIRYTMGVSGEVEPLLSGNRAVEMTDSLFQNSTHPRLAEYWPLLSTLSGLEDLLSYVSVIDSIGEFVATDPRGPKLNMRYDIVVEDNDEFEYLVELMEDEFSDEFIEFDNAEVQVNRFTFNYQNQTLLSQPFWTYSLRDHRADQFNIRRQEVKRLCWQIFVDRHIDLLRPSLSQGFINAQRADLAEELQRLLIDQVNRSSFHRFEEVENRLNGMMIQFAKDLARMTTISAARGPQYQARDVIRTLAELYTLVEPWQASWEVYDIRIICLDMRDEVGRIRITRLSNT